MVSNACAHSLPGADLVQLARCVTRRATSSTNFDQYFCNTWLPGVGHSGAPYAGVPMTYLRDLYPERYVFGPNINHALAVLRGVHHVLTTGTPAQAHQLRSELVNGYVGAYNYMDGPDWQNYQKLLRAHRLQFSALAFQVYEKALNVLDKDLRVEHAGYKLDITGIHDGLPAVMQEVLLTLLIGQSLARTRRTGFKQAHAHVTDIVGRYELAAVAA